MITQTQVQELFEYREGCLYWRKNISNVRAGTRAGSLGKNQYRVVYIEGRPYKEHRVIYLYHTGEWPPVVDHKDGVPNNNAIENLRGATNQQNSFNSGPKVGCFKGVDYHEGSWRARIGIDGKSVYLGGYRTPEEAALAYNKAAKEFHGEFAYQNTVENR